MISKKSGFSLAVMAIGLAMLSACTPADIEYCSKFGVAGTAEYGKCLDYYQQQQAAFTADYNVCASEADITYPATLYDHGGFAHVGVGMNASNVARRNLSLKRGLAGADGACPFPGVGAGAAPAGSSMNSTSHQHTA
jgi:hypothetical protein